MNNKMTHRQISLIAEMLTDHPDVFTEDIGGGPMGSGGMSGDISKPSSVKRPADNPTDQESISATDPTANKPLNSVEIEKQADEIGGNDVAADAMSNSLKMQQDMEKQQQVERQKIIQPQFDQLNSAMTGLQQGVLQGKQAATSGGEQFGALEKEMVGLNTLLGNLQKQM